MKNQSLMEQLQDERNQQQALNDAIRQENLERSQKAADARSELNS